GLSEVGSDTIRRAHAVHPIVDLQIEYSLIERGVERDILTTCRELGIGITAYGVLARGLISGHWSKDSSKVGKDYRLMTPRFQGANLDANLALVDSLRAIAAEIGATPAQVAIAWVAAQGNDIVPLVGARSRNRLAEALGATKLTLTPAHSGWVGERVITAAPACRFASAEPDTIVSPSIARLKCPASSNARSSAP